MTWVVGDIAETVGAGHVAGQDYNRIISDSRESVCRCACVYLSLDFGCRCGRVFRRPGDLKRHRKFCQNI